MTTKIYTGSLQTYAVTTSGFYDIFSEGAQGGGSTLTSGGLGATVEGVFYLSAGTVLNLVVGGEGVSGDNLTGLPGGGGGGGTFIYTVANTLIQAAGGGGGGGFQGSQNGQPGQIITSGSGGTAPSFGLGGASGAGGAGATGVNGGAGGAGWASSGTNASSASGGFGGNSFPGFAGGAGTTLFSATSTNGGYGGGGGGGSYGAGGGGGYSGGGGGGYSVDDLLGGAGGGGGSYILAQASNQVLTAGVGTGNGQVTINQDADFLMQATVSTSGVNKIYQIGGSNTVPVTSDTPWWGNTALAVSFASATQNYFPEETTPDDSSFMFSYDTNVGVVWTNTFGGGTFQNAPVIPGTTVFGYVEKIPTTVTTTATVDTVPVTTIQFGETVRLGATIDDGINTNYLGTTDFYSNGVLLGTGTVPGNGGFVFLNTDDLTVGVNNITAVYSGDAASAASTSAVITVNVTASPNTVPSSVSINGYNFSNSVLSGSATYASVAGDYCTVNLTNGSGYYGSINTLISTANLVALSNPNLQSAGLLSNGEQLLPQAPLSLAVLNQFIEPSASALHYLFASGLTSGSKISLTNSADLTPYLTQVAVVNSLNNSTALLNISTFSGIVISGKGVSVTGLTTDNHVIGCGDASYTFGVGTQTMALAGGNAFIDGSNGINTVIVQDANYFNLAVSTTVNGSNAATQIWTNQGVSTLVNVDYLQFNDRTIAINVGVGQSGGQAYRLYQAAFDRTPDTAGLSNWITQLDQGASLVMIANAFMNSPEFAATYGANLSNTALVNALYSNVLGRAGEAAGQAYWINALNSGTSRAQVLASFSESNENVGNVAGLIANGIEVELVVG